jgi:hypothetical protein
MVKLRHTPDELATLGDELFKRDVLPRTTAADAGCYVAIDVESGAWAIHADQLAAADQLLARNPDALLYFRRVGTKYAHRFGGRVQPRSSGRV